MFVTLFKEYFFLEIAAYIEWLVHQRSFEADMSVSLANEHFYEPES